MGGNVNNIFIPKKNDPLKNLSQNNPKFLSKLKTNYQFKNVLITNKEKNYLITNARTM